MTPNTDRALPRFARRHASWLVAGALVLGGFGLSGFSIIRAVHKVIHNVEGNKATMDAFTNKIQSGPTTFEAKYVTTGSSPATVWYAVEKPNGLWFKLTQSGKSASNGNLDVIVNPTGEYVCTPPSASSGATWKCTKLPKASAADYNNILDFYTPTHWVDFLKGLALVAGFAGDKVSDSSLTVNGFAMSCVDLTPPGVGTSKICTTAQNILGYVQVAAGTGTATDNTRFEIEYYSSSPAASLFQLPPGATVTTVTLPPTTTTTTS